MLYRKNYAQVLINADDAITNSGLVLSTSTITVILLRLVTTVPNGAANMQIRSMLILQQLFLFKEHYIKLDQWVSAGSPVYRKNG
jgi:hypothetical protein